MPTELEMRFLSNLIHGLDIGELRGLIMHVAEREFEVVGAEALRIKEDRGHHSARHQPEVEPNDVTLESDLESYTLSDDQPEDDSNYEIQLAGPSTLPPRRAPPLPTQTASTSVTSTQQRSKAERMHDLLNGLRTKSQRESLTRIAGIIDTFNWKTGNRSDFINQYIGTVHTFPPTNRPLELMIQTNDPREHYPTAGWAAIVRTHGDRLRRYSSDFGRLYPYKKRVGRASIRGGIGRIVRQVGPSKKKEGLKEEH